MDSGSSICGVNCDKLTPGAEVTKSDAQIRGDTYTCANGGALINKGQATTDVRFEKRDGHQRSITWQNVDTDVPTSSTAYLTDDPDHPSDVLNGKEQGQVIEKVQVGPDRRSSVPRHGNVYCMKICMNNTVFERQKGFVRPGADA